MFKNIDYIKYTWNHKKWFLKVEKSLTGRNTLFGYLHDTDKLFLYLIFSKEMTTSIHRRISKHHFGSFRKLDYTLMIIDWECARFSKPDKALNARDTLTKYYNDKFDLIDPILKKYNL